MPGGAAGEADSSQSSVLAGDAKAARRANRDDACEAPGPLLELLAADVRQRFPTVANIRVAEVRSLRWAMKHLAVTVSTAGDGTAVIGVHAIAGDFGSVLRTLDVFAGSSDEYPVIHRVAGDSVVVIMEPEKGDRSPDARKAYEWRSVEEP